MKTQRIRDRVKKYLEGEPKNIVEILDDLNSHFKHGSTMQQLGNVLSKDIDIIKIGKGTRLCSTTGSYFITEWALKDNIAMT